MREDFLHYLWRTKRFHLDNLRSTEGEPLQISNFGKHNHHAGPDFLEAKIQIGDTCLLYTSPSPRDQRGSRMPSSA